MFQTARLGDPCTHDAKIITSSSTRFVGGQPVALVGDLVDCPQHGVNKIIAPTDTVMLEGKAVARFGSLTECGAKVMTVYNDGGGGSVTVDRFNNVVVMDERDLGNEDDDESGDGLAIWPKPTGAPTAAQLAQHARNAVPVGDPLEVDDTAPPPPPAVLPTDCAGITDAIGDTFLLSANFQLGDLSTWTECAKRKPADSGPVVANMGLSRAQIICNLRGLATNCLEPLAAQYGRKNLVINSAFRNAQGGSQHNIGEAADIRLFKNGRMASNAELLEVAKWVRDHLPYYQVLLEYLSPNGPWLHIGYRKGQRKPDASACSCVVYDANRKQQFIPGLRLY